MLRWASVYYVQSDQSKKSNHQKNQITKNNSKPYFEFCINERKLNITCGVNIVKGMFVINWLGILREINMRTKTKGRPQKWLFKRWLNSHPHVWIYVFNVNVSNSINYIDEFRILLNTGRGDYLIIRSLLDYENKRLFHRLWKSNNQIVARLPNGMFKKINRIGDVKISNEI